MREGDSYGESPHRGGPLSAGNGVVIRDLTRKAASGLASAASPDGDGEKTQRQGTVFGATIDREKGTILLSLTNMGDPFVISTSDMAVTSKPQTLEDKSAHSDKAITLLKEVEIQQVNIEEFEEELSQTENAVEVLHSTLVKMDQKKSDTIRNIKQLKEMINDKGLEGSVQVLLSRLELLKNVERKEAELLSFCKRKTADTHIYMGESESTSIDNERSGFTDFDKYLKHTLERRNLKKKEHAAKARAILSLKLHLDDVPAQAELIQYEYRFSELYSQIQEKLQHTRKHYATYNALMEIKELMIKETSLLNSLNLQFQEAITTATGRSKLIDSMEVILKGTQQKLTKVQLSLYEEQKICDKLKERYSTAVVEQRHFSSLLMAFQEEYDRNERLRSLISI